jgi:hypothetical protein
VTCGVDDTRAHPAQIAYNPAILITSFALPVKAYSHSSAAYRNRSQPGC